MPKKISLNQDEGKIYRLLSTQHLGPEACITNAKLAEAVGLPERACRFLVENLRKTYGLPIVPDYGRGIFWARSRAELFEHADAIQEHALSMMTTVSHMKKQGGDLLSGNLEIDFGGEPDRRGDS